ncbi:MAG: hypothetical protein ACJA2H_001215, partial [Nitriliruptoraceae bacterium]
EAYLGRPVEHDAEGNVLVNEMEDEA